MKKLVLIRHTEAEQPISGIKDFDRALNSKGVRTALKVGIILDEKRMKIDQIVSSNSRRTQMTTEYVTERTKTPESLILYKEELYLAPLRIWLQEISQLDDHKDSIVMIGHNPEISYLVEYLTGENLGSIPTGATLAIDFEIDTWEAVSQNTGNLSWKIYPNEDFV